MGDFDLELYNQLVDELLQKHLNNLAIDLRYRNMLGRTRREPEVDIEQGFPYLPVGCHLDLDHVAKDIVLKNIREALPTSWKQRTQERRELVTSPPARYLQETGLELDAI